MSAGEPSGVDTRTALILTAERLFAEHGIDNVSLRQVNAAAGQRNTSAAHYHFGSKEALIRAIYDYRLDRVNPRREAMLRKLQAQGRATDVRALIGAIVYPIVEEASRSEGGRHYIRFVVQMAEAPHEQVRRIWRERPGECAQEIMACLRAALPDVDATLVEERFHGFFVQTLHALAELERTGGRTQKGDPLPLPLLVSGLVDMLAAGLAAPVSEETRIELARYRELRHRKT